MGPVAAIFKMAAMNFQCPISLRIIYRVDRKLIFVSLSLISGPQNPNMVNILVCGACGSHFLKMAAMNFQCPISRRIIDMKLIVVSMPMFSVSRNPNVAITLVCGGCGSQFQNGRHEFSMSHISANNIDMTFIFVSLTLISGPNMVNILVYFRFC